MAFFRIHMNKRGAENAALVWAMEESSCLTTTYNACDHRQQQEIVELAKIRIEGSFFALGWSERTK